MKTAEMAKLWKTTSKDSRKYRTLPITENVFNRVLARATQKRSTQ